MIASDSVEQHQEDLRKVLQVLKEATVKLDVRKSEFAMSEIRWCGYLISANGVRPDPTRMSKLDDFLKEVPSTKKYKKLTWQKRFGLTGYYRKFIPGYSEIETRMREKIWKVRKKEMDHEIADKEILEDFKFMIDNIRKNQLLIADSNTPIRIRTDASIRAIEVQER